MTGWCKEPGNCAERLPERRWTDVGSLCRLLQVPLWCGWVDEGGVGDGKMGVCVMD